MKKRNYRAQKVNEIQWEAVAQRVKDKAVVLAMRLTTVARLSKGRPRQFLVTNENIRCSILFHLLVLGGK